MNRLRLVLFVIYLTLIAAVFAEAGFYLGLKSFDTDQDYLTRLIWTLAPMSAPILIAFACANTFTDSPLFLFPQLLLLSD